MSPATTLGSLSRSPPHLAVLLGVLAITAGAGARPAPTIAAPLSDQTIQSLMDKEIDPSADALWSSVGTIETKSGVVHRAPQTPAEWARAQARAQALESGAEKLEHPRPVGANGAGLADAATPGIRTAVEIGGEIRADPHRFYEAAERLRLAAASASRASAARNPAALLAAGAAMDAACESCHSAYWYPKTRLALPSKKAFEGAVWGK